MGDPVHSSLSAATRLRGFGGRLSKTAACMTATAALAGLTPLVTLGAAIVTEGAPASALAEPAPSLAAVVGQYASTPVEEGRAVGVGVAVVRGTAPARIFTFGDASADPVNIQPFSARSVFAIGSVTKTFTTNLLGQKVSQGVLSLSDTLGDFSAQLGTLRPRTGRITLEELGDFTAGLPTYAPRCSKPRTPGCLPAPRPTIDAYGAARFVDFFRNTKPSAPLPAPYEYSDFSVGLLGLLLGSTPGTPLSDAALDRWYAGVRADLLQPLGMRHTYLFLPYPTPPLALGYDLALADATPNAQGQIQSVAVTNTGSGFTRAPAVRIVGGGGGGATATATLKEQAVTAIVVTDGGSGYVAPATVAFNDGGSSSTARARVIVSDGHVAALEILSGGKGYKTAPRVTISGRAKCPGRAGHGGAPHRQRAGHLRARDQPRLRLRATALGGRRTG